MTETEGKINFRGSKSYAEMLTRARLDRGLPSVQAMLERAVDFYLRNAPNERGGAELRPNGPALVPPAILPIQDEGARTYDISGVKISKQEIPWVIKFLNLIRAKSSTVRKAIKWNCLSFGLVPEGAEIEHPAARGLAMSENDLDALVQEVIGTTNELAEIQGDPGKSAPKTGDRRAGGRKKVG